MLLLEASEGRASLILALLDRIDLPLYTLNSLARLMQLFCQLGHPAAMKIASFGTIKLGTSCPPWRCFTLLQGLSKTSIVLAYLLDTMLSLVLVHHDSVGVLW